MDQFHKSNLMSGMGKATDLCAILLRITYLRKNVARNNVAPCANLYVCQ